MKGNIAIQIHTETHKRILISHGQKSDVRADTIVRVNFDFFTGDFYNKTWHRKFINLPSFSTLMYMCVD